MNPTSNSRIRVAKEAATLLYFGVEKEFKQAKLKAAKTLGASFLPSNLEVALELDRITEDNEGEKRRKRLVSMRKEALKLMKILRKFEPILVGSVWRGTVHQGSDIDISLYHDVSSEIISLLEKKGYFPRETVRVAETKKGKREASLHIYVETPGKRSVELVVRSLEEKSQNRKCEIFGDEIRGLQIQELERLLEQNPEQRFVPF